MQLGVWILLVQNLKRLLIREVGIRLCNGRQNPVFHTQWKPLHLRLRILDISRKED